MIQLRDYQQKFKADVMAAWQTYRSVLGVLPTGGGKTMTFASIVSEHKGASIIVVHRREILSQISQSVAIVSEGLAEERRMHRVIAPQSTIAMIRRKHLARFGKSYIDASAQTAVASVQTLTSKATEKDHRLQSFFKQVTLAVFDEGHHYVGTGFWARAVHLFDHSKLLFVTACPERADGTGLGVEHGGFADVMVEGPQVRYLMDRGHLAKYEYVCPDSDFDVGGIALTATGDFNATAMRSRVVESHLVGDLVKHYFKFAQGTQAIAFVESIPTSDELAAAFNAAGVPAASLSSKTDEAERERALAAFEAGELRMLVNVDLFDEGFDVPAATTCLLGRATMSLNKYMQMVGRVLRVAEGKEKAIIIDPVRNWERHGQVSWPRVWSLKGRDKSDREASDKPQQRVCTECSQPYMAFETECPYCHAVPEPVERSAPEKVDGDLSLLDLDALDALFAARERANMSDDAFAVSLYNQDENGKIIPPQHHGKQIARFRATKYRRDVLRNLIGWWVGCQPAGRSQAEIQKRFFLRFGVDMLTADALDLKDTDALIEKISKRFDSDLAHG